MPKKRSTAGEVLWFIETYIRVPEGRDVGKPLVLLPYQREFIVAVFDNPVGTRRAILSVARKAGKSTLIAALLLAYIVGPLHQPNAQIFSAALSREQASLIFALMSKMVRLHPDLMSRITVKDSTRELHCAETGVHFRALSAEASTAMGTSPLAFVFDELGQVDAPMCDLFDALHTGQAAHSMPVEFIISTQASQDSHILSTIIDDALTGADPHVVCHLHTAPAGCDLLDESAWHLANPALGSIVSLEHLRKDALEAQRMPSREPQFRRFNLNQRVEEASPFVGRSVWEANGAEPARYEGEPVYAGLDLSSVSDLTALVVIWKRADAWQVVPYFWTAEKGLAERSRRDHAGYVEWAAKGFLRALPGATVDVDLVAAELLEILSDYDVRLVAFDRWRMDVLKGALLRRGAPESFMEKLQPFGQGFQSMAPAVDALEAALLNARLAHGGHPVLSMCASNLTIAADAAGNRKLDKARSTGRIDGMVALVMAMGAAANADAEVPEPEPTFQMFFA